MLLQSASKPHIVIIRHKSTHIPQAVGLEVGLLLPVRRKRLERNREHQDLGQDISHRCRWTAIKIRWSPLIVLFIVEAVQYRQFKDCYSSVWKTNASKVPCYVESGLCVKSVHGFTAADGETLFSLHIIGIFYISAENVREITDLRSLRAGSIIWMPR